MNNTKEWFKDSAVRGAFVASVFAVVITLIGITAFFSAKSLDNSISVTGSARRAVVSDSAKITLTLRRSASFVSVAEGYKNIAANTAIVQASIVKAGFTDADITITPPSADQIYDNTSRAPEERQYDIREVIEIRSADIKKIENLSKSITSVSLPGLVIEVRPVEYLYTKLADIRVELFAEAIKDARVRAEAIASTSGGKVGKIKTAATGVVQVLPPQSSDVTDYGTFDTTTMNKEVMVTARATFNLR